MKAQRALIPLFALFMGGSAVAQQQMTAALKSAIVAPPKQTVHWFEPGISLGKRNDLRPVEGLSVRAWTTTAGWYPGRSAFLSDRTDGSQLCLFWIGHGPWQDWSSSTREE